MDVVWFCCSMSFILDFIYRNWLYNIFARRVCFFSGLDGLPLPTIPNTDSKAGLPCAILLSLKKKKMAQKVPVDTGNLKGE